MMADPPSKPPGPAFLDNPHAPEMLAEGAAGFFLLNGNVHITLTALKVDHSKTPAPVRRVVIGRLVLPSSGAQALALDLYNFLDRHGIAPNRDRAHSKLQ
jgi:hypothetical protein